jgi:hypothetical protein
MEGAVTIAQLGIPDTERGRHLEAKRLQLDADHLQARSPSKHGLAIKRETDQNFMETMRSSLPIPSDPEGYAALLQSPCVGRSVRVQTGQTIFLERRAPITFRPSQMVRVDWIVQINSHSIGHHGAINCDQ